MNSRIVIYTEEGVSGLPIQRGQIIAIITIIILLTAGLAIAEQDKEKRKERGKPDRDDKDEKHDKDQGKGNRDKNNKKPEDDEEKEKEIEKKTEEEEKREEEEELGEGRGEELGDSGDHPSRIKHVDSDENVEPASTEEGMTRQLLPIRPKARRTMWSRLRRQPGGQRAWRR